MNMNSNRGWITKTVLATAVLLLGGCLLGPWDLTPQIQVAKVQLEVGLMLVQGRPFDTLWIERPMTFANAYDSSKAFIDSGKSRILVIRTDISPPDTVSYRMSSLNTRVWLPDSGKHSLIQQGARYRFSALVNWDAARDFPRQHEIRNDTLSAET